jgi:endonuclease I
MKILANLIILISFSTNLHASVQAYYSQVNNLKGFALKSALSKKLRATHRDNGYGALINVYFSSDIDETYDNDGGIVDIYSENPNSDDQYTFRSRKEVCGQYKRESDCFNREHLFPQSVFNKQRPMRTDFFHIYPTDGYVNNRRGSYPFGEVKRAEWTSRNGSKLGKNTFGDYNGKVFEPIDEFKGDIARALLYFATRYENKIHKWNHAMLDGSNTRVYKGWFIALLLKWHKLDPVSAHELKRNDIGYKFQGNRNPFIDHPEYVDMIWGHLKY